MSKRHDSDFIGRRNFLKQATFVGAAVVAPGLAANAQRPSKNPVPEKPNELSADEVRKLLKLEPHATCGFVRVTFMSKERIAPGGLPGAIRCWAACWLRALFHGNAGRTRSAASH